MSVPGRWRRWREATEEALYGEPDGFFVRERPAGHFRTSVHASPLFATAVAELLRRVDEKLGRPEELTFLDVGAGRGELLTGVMAAVPPELGARLRPCAVERAARPDGLDERIGWLPDLPEPDSVTGLVFANEWLDDVPLDVAETDDTGEPRWVQVAPDGTERLGAPVTGPDAEWLARWWPLGGEPGLRAEIGRPRDAAWTRAVRCVAAGLAVAVDYAHERAARPLFGTLTGFRDGREVRPVPDGSCDITAHVALDACAVAASDAAEGPEVRSTGGGHRTGAGRAAPAARRPDSSPAVPAAPQQPGGALAAPFLLTQREALRALGLRGGRPPLTLASGDPAAYVRALGAAGEAAELTDAAGLGAFTWLVQPVGLSPADLTPIGLPAGTAVTERD